MALKVPSIKLGYARPRFVLSFHQDTIPDLNNNLKRLFSQNKDAAHDSAIHLYTLDLMIQKRKSAQAYNKEKLGAEI